MKSNAKIIFHIDLNQFFCSVAINKNPRLKGKAFAIGRENTLKGVISTASYEARAYGVNSGMSLVDAFNKLPTLIVVSYPYSLYQEYSWRFFNIIKEYVDVVEQTSIDEGFIDVTELVKTKKIHPVKLAHEMQKRVLEELNLPCSVGISHTLYLAKMASDLKKPLGVTVIREKDIKEKLYPLSVSAIFGIGKKTYPKLIASGIKTIGDFMDISNKDKIISITGSQTYESERKALSGNSSDIIDPNRYSDPESISRSTTFDNPLTTYDEVEKEILYLLNDVYKSMLKEKKKAKTIGITLRDKSFKTITRSKSLKEATDDLSAIQNLIVELIEDNYKEGIAYRLVGASLGNLIDNNFKDKEINLFNYEEYYGKEEKIREIIKKFGSDKIKIGL